MKKLFYTILIFTIPLQLFSKTKYIKYKFDKNKAAYGDSVTLSWEAPKKYDVTISGYDTVFPYIGQLKVPVYNKQRFIIFAQKGKKVLSRKTRTIKILYPEILYFTAHRLKDKPEDIEIIWSTENYKKITIDYLNDSIASSGRAVITEPKMVKIALKATNYVNETLVKHIHISKDFSLNRDHLKGLSNYNKNDSLPYFMEVFAINVSDYPEQIELKVLAYDTLGNFVTGLAPPFNTKENAKSIFKNVFVKGAYGEKPVSFTVREIREEEREKADIAFVMDHSGSMNNYIDDFKEIAQNFVLEKTQHDRISLTVFDHRIYNLNKLTKDTLLLTQFIKENKFLLGGSTALYAACDEGLESIRYSNNEKYLVVFTDGRENASFPYYGVRATDANSLSNKIRKLNTKLFVVGFGNKVNYPVLEELCNLCNGKFYSTHNFNDLKKALFEINLLIKSYYSITFSPPKSSGPTGVKLIYQNHNSDMLIEDVYFIGDILHINEQESNNVFSPIKDSIKLVFPPQVIANFQYNKSFIENQFIKPLSFYAEYLRKNPEVQILVSGHSDSRGKEYQRQRISEKRAESVAHFLAGKGIADNRVKTEYYSFSRPLHPIENEEWQARENRRVELILYTTNK